MRSRRELVEDLCIAKVRHSGFFGGPGIATMTAQALVSEAAKIADEIERQTVQPEATKARAA